jgi:hypothetical protein
LEFKEIEETKKAVVITFSGFGNRRDFEKQGEMSSLLIADLEIKKKSKRVKEDIFLSICRFSVCKLFAQFPFSLYIYGSCFIITKKLAQTL